MIPIIVSFIFVYGQVELRDACSIIQKEKKSRGAKSKCIYPKYTSPLIFLNSCRKNTEIFDSRILRDTTMKEKNPD